MLRSERRTIVVDTGFDHAEAAQRGRTITCVPADVLGRFGVDAASVEDVIITHLHYDHAGTLGDFKRAKFHIQEAEPRCHSRVPRLIAGEAQPRLNGSACTCPRRYANLLLPTSGEVPRCQRD